jgi:hypothetical protein
LKKGRFKKRNLTKKERFNHNGATLISRRTQSKDLRREEAMREEKGKKEP